MVLAVLLVIGQGAVVLLLVKFVRTFGVYTQQLVEIHRTNLMILEQHQEMLTRIELLRDKEAA